MENKPLLDGTADWSKLSFIRQNIVERNYKGCIELTPDQVQTVLKLAEEYDCKESEEDDGNRLIAPEKEMKELFRQKILTINEVRKCYGLKSIPEGNKIYQGW